MCIRDRSVGEVMAIGRNFLEALQKACQSQENRRMGLGADKKEWIQTQDILCLLYTSDAADERSSVDLGGRRIIKKKKNVHVSVG